VPEGDTDAGAPLAADAELERLAALPLEERAAALGETVRRLEAELDATEANGAGGGADRDFARGERGEPSSGAGGGADRTFARGERGEPSSGAGGGADRN